MRPRNLMSFEHTYIDCKACGRRITLAIHSYEHVPVSQHRRAEKLQCQVCFKVCVYFGDDFKTATLTHLMRPSLTLSRRGVSFTG